jgi:hypothetical protein
MRALLCSFLLVTLLLEQEYLDRVHAIPRPYLPPCMSPASFFFRMQREDLLVACRLSSLV